MGYGMSGLSITKKIKIKVKKQSNIPENRGKTEVLEFTHEPERMNLGISWEFGDYFQLAKSNKIKKNKLKIGFCWCARGNFGVLLISRGDNRH